MKLIAKIVLAAAAAVVVPALAGEVQSYGRAGGAVGAERVQHVASYVSPRDLREFDAGYGRAGGAVANASARTGTPEKGSASVAWYGRAGGPLAFGG